MDPAVTGLPPGAVTTPISGLPPGAVTTPIRGMPSGAVATPVQASAPSAQSAPQSRGIGGVADWLEGKGDTNKGGWDSPVLAPMVGGAVKSAASGLGGVMDMLNHFGKAITPEAVQRYQANTIQHVQDAANWLRTGSTPQGFMENVGAVGEQALEFMGTDGLLKMVGPAAGVMETGEHLKQAQQAAQTLKNNPKIAGLVAIGLKASKDAAMMGAQTYAHTEDPTQAALAAGTGGLLRAGGEAVGGKLAGMMERAPKTIDIEGNKVPVLASQLNESKVPIETGTAGAPEIARAQEEAGPKVVGSLAQRATRTALERLNATRPIADTTELGEPITFSVEGLPRDEAGGAAQGPGRKLIGKQPLLTGATEPEEAAAAKPSGTAGTYTTKDPSEAESWLSHMKSVQQSPAHDTFTDLEKQQLQDRIDNLSDQLGMFHAGGRRAPVDIDSAVGRVMDFGHASDQIEGAVKPVFAQFAPESVDELGEQMRKYNRAASNLQDATGSRFDAAEQQMEEASEAINGLLTRNAGNVTPDEYRAARQGWRDKVLLDRLHVVTENMMNGTTAAEAKESGSEQLMRRSNIHTRKLEAFLMKQNNRSLMEGLIGADGIQNFKNMTRLMSDSAVAGTTKDVSRNVGAELSRQLGKHGAITGVGAWAARAMGLPGYLGAGAAEAMVGARRFVLKQAITNPSVGTLVDYAVRHNVDPKIYAPLIARTIARLGTSSMQEPESEKPEGGQQQPPEQEGRSRALNPYKNPEDQPPDEALQFNRQWAKQGSYTTQLNPGDEQKFQQWVRANKVPWQDSPKADYDMRGYWKALQQGQAKQEYNEWDHTMHFPDTWKTPYSGTFSRESKYASPNAPEWRGDVLTTRDGRVVVDETPR